MRALLIATTLSTQCKREDAAPSPRGAGYARAGNQYARSEFMSSKSDLQTETLSHYEAMRFLIDQTESLHFYGIGDVLSPAARLAAERRAVG